MTSAAVAPPICTCYGHMQHDALTIGYEALHATFLPEQGYYRGEAHRTEWDMNWAIHYCGRIVGARGEPVDAWGRQGQQGGKFAPFGDGGWARVATAGRRFYHDLPPCADIIQLTDDLLVERTIGLIDIDARRSYAVSIFRMTGGTDHYLSFHGPRGTALPAGLQGTTSPTGTLAGPDVPYGLNGTRPGLEPTRNIHGFPLPVRCAERPAPGTLERGVELQNYPDIHLRLHGMGPGRLGSRAGQGEATWRRFAL